MKKQNLIILVVAVVLMAGTAAILSRLQSGQKLGKPGVTTTAIPDSKNLKVVLPPKVLNCKAEFLEPDQSTITTLPADTSYGQARYTAADGFIALINVVLMGRDRTSLHKPQFCLAGMGWNIDNAASSEDKIRIASPEPYDLPVVKLIATKQFQQNGQTVSARGIYVYWFVADDAISASVTGFERMWWMGAHLFKTGELQRWAYVSCFSVCAQGREDAAYARMREFIAASVPEFQKKPGSPMPALAAAP
jgi:hypothetical protein